ncbi:MAG: hypothetical protein CFE28_15945 [Alphaproteobacteria bacterium PA2]|nr:MAG: hypothetical protein CFE28_15945 [Alphaproteobacteria bacterium PA2]
MTNAETLRAFFADVWNGGDVAACDRYLAPQYAILSDPGDPWDGQILSVEGFKARMTTSRAPFPEQCFHIETLLEAGDDVMVSWTWTGTHLGDLPGFPASGREFTLKGMTHYVFEAGRIRGHWQVVDRLGLVTQLQAASRGQ